MAQWAQLKEDVLQNLGSCPIIITGDMNSFYGRDEVKREFIDAINDSGRGTVSDVWVELQLGGVYPTSKVTYATAGNEALDKILYINPALGTMIKPVAYTIDKDDYLYDGKPLGDHFPVSATFQFVERKMTGIEDVTSGSSQESELNIYTLDGVKVSRQVAKGIYIEQSGEKTSKRIMK
jgi:hypothetical protein